MVQKRLLSEIASIHRIMGINKVNLINEQSIWGKILGLADNYMSTASKATRGAVDDISVGGVIIKKDLYNQFLEAIENPSLISYLDKAELKTLGKILSQSPEIVEDAYIGSIQKFLRNTPGATERDLYEAIATEMNATNKTFNEVVSEILGDDLADGILVNKMARKFREFNDGTFKVDVTPVASVATKKLLSSDEIKLFNKVVNSKGIKTFIGDVAQLYKKDLDTIKTEIVELSNGFVSSLQGKTETEVQEALNAYAVAISRKLDLAEIKMNGAAADVLDNMGVNPQIVSKIKNAEDGFLKVFRDARAADEQGFLTVIGNVFKEFVTEIGDLVKGLFRKEANTIVRAFNPKTSIGQFFYTNQWASLNKLWRLAIKMSPGVSRDNMMKFLAAASVASGIGFIFGSMVKSVGVGLWNLYVKGGWNWFVRTLGGEDGIIGNPESWASVDINSWLTDTPDLGTDNALLAPIISMGQVLSDDIIRKYNDEGVKDILLRMFPGGLLTYPESLAAGLLESVTRAVTNNENYTVPNIRNLGGWISEVTGLSSDEIEKNTTDVETNTPTTPEIDLTPGSPDMLKKFVEYLKSELEMQPNEDLGGDVKYEGDRYIYSDGEYSTKYNFENDSFKITE